MVRGVSIEGVLPTQNQPVYEWQYQIAIISCRRRMREESPKRSSNRWILIVMAIMIVILVIMSTNRSSYTRFTLVEGDVHFSFEYPSSYEETFNDVSSQSSMVSFDRSIVEENWIVEDSYLRVHVYRAGFVDGPDAEAALEATIASFATDEHYSDFEILDRSSVTIAGVEGEQVTFSYYYPEAIPSFDDEGPFFKLPLTFIVRCACFEYNGFIWEIRLQSTEGVADEDKVHFEHILETFAFPD
jgi:hypothetical protein